MFFIQDSLPLNEEIELICEFNWPVSKGNIFFQPPENYTLSNMVLQGTGSRNSLFLGADSSTYFKKAFHFFLSARTLGAASISNLSFNYRLQNSLISRKMMMNDQQIWITPPRMESDKHRLGWLIVVVFFAINAVVIVIFSRKRKYSSKRIDEFSKKYLKVIKAKISNPEKKLKKEDLLLFFWELWELQFHLDKSAAISPLATDTVEALGLSDKEKIEFEVVIKTILSDSSEAIGSEDDDLLTKGIRLLIQKREKQLQ